MRPIGASIWICSLLLPLVAQAKDAMELKYLFEKRGKPYLHGFTLTWGGPQKNLQTIEVTAADSGESIQKISIPQDKVKIIWDEIQTSKPQETREAIFDQLDYNFDRFPDIRLLTEFPPKVGKKSYLVYLFQKEKNQYILNEEISALPAPLPQPKSKRIEAVNLGGFGGFESTTEQYAVTPTGKLVLEVRITTKVTDALRLTLEKEVFVLNKTDLKPLCKVQEEPEGVRRFISGNPAECIKYVAPPKPKRIR